jgi:hypothetical protein
VDSATQRRLSRWRHSARRFVATPQIEPDFSFDDVACHKLIAIVPDAEPWIGADAEAKFAEQRCR